MIAHLVSAEMALGKSPVEAVKAALPRLRGAFALAFLFAGEEDLLIGARKGSPLAIGFGDDAMYVGSDAIALAPFTDTVSYLEDGDCAVIHRGSAEIHDASGRAVRRDVRQPGAVQGPQNFPGRRAAPAEQVEPAAVPRIGVAVRGRRAGLHAPILVGAGIVAAVRCF